MLIQAIKSRCFLEGVNALHASPPTFILSFANKYYQPREETKAMNS